MSISSTRPLSPKDSLLLHPRMVHGESGLFTSQISMGMSSALRHASPQQQPKSLCAAQRIRAASDTTKRSIVDTRRRIAFCNWYTNDTSTSSFTASFKKGFTKQCARTRRTRMVTHSLYQANAFLAKALKKISKDKFDKMIVFLGCNWLQVLGATELAQIDQRVRHQFHAIVPLLDTFKSKQEPLACVLPRKGPLDPHP